jgi:hypothetical protein
MGAIRDSQLSSTWKEEPSAAQAGYQVRTGKMAAMAIRWQ